MKLLACLPKRISPCCSMQLLSLSLFRLDTGRPVQGLADHVVTTSPRLTVTERVWTSPAVKTLKKDTIVKQQADVEATVTETLVTSNAAHQKANEVHTIDPLNKPDERLARQAVKLTSLHESVFRTKESGVTRGATHMRNELASMAIDRSRRLENEKRIAAMRDDLQADNEDSRAEDELAATLIEIEKRDEDWRRMLHDK